jgi:hypothetical protein
MKGEMRIEFESGEVLGFEYDRTEVVPLPIQWAAGIVLGTTNTPLRIVSAEHQREYHPGDVKTLWLDVDASHDVGFLGPEADA